MSKKSQDSSDNKNITNNADVGRRQFLANGAGGLLLAAIGAKALLQSPRAFAAEEMVKADDAQAKSLGYNPDAKKVDTKTWTKRAGAEGAKQFCYNCMFFQATGDAKKAKTAPCQIFAGKLVPSHAWCNTWTQNPNVKG